MPPRSCGSLLVISDITPRDRVHRYVVLPPSRAGWAKAPLRRAHHLPANRDLDGGRASLCPPCGLVARACDRHTCSSKLREAIANGPILFRRVQDVHEHIPRPDAGALTEKLRDPPEQRLFLFRG